MIRITIILMISMNRILHHSVVVNDNNDDYANSHNDDDHVDNDDDKTSDTGNYIFTMQKCDLSER